MTQQHHAIISALVLVTGALFFAHTADVVALVILACLAVLVIPAALIVLIRRERVT